MRPSPVDLTANTALGAPDISKGSNTFGLWANTKARFKRWVLGDRVR